MATTMRLFARTRLLIPGTERQRKCSRWSLHSRLGNTESDL